MRIRKSIAVISVGLLTLSGCSSGLPEEAPTQQQQQQAPSAPPLPSRAPSAQPTHAPAPGPGDGAGGGGVAYEEPVEDLPDSARINGTGGAPDPASATAFLEAVVLDADKVWTKWMTQQGYAEPFVDYVIIQPGTSYEAPEKCALPQPPHGVVSNVYQSTFPNTFYCDVPTSSGTKGLLLLPLQTYIDMWSGKILGSFTDADATVGDFAAAAVVAHEFGHHVSQEMAAQMSFPIPADKNKELLADCFSGVWSHTLYQAGGLETGDVDEAMSALRAIGDDGTGSDPHGTPEERERAFRVGVAGLDTDPRGGVPGLCINEFWAGYPGPR